MQLAMVGLGRMGSNMVRRLLRGGHTCVVYDRNEESVKALEREGAVGARTIDELLRLEKAPRVIWLMLPSGAPTEETITTIGLRLDAGDILVDGGNSLYKDAVRRAALVGAHGVHYLDVGTSGGIWGLERGYCLMIGGPREAFTKMEPIWRCLSPGQGNVERTPGRSTEATDAEQGFLYCGGHGAGHFVKMIHNGIEYGLMQAYAEGFDVLRNAGSEKLPSELRYELPLPEIAELWRRGSVVGSFLLDLSAAALLEDANLDKFVGSVDDSGEGRWTIQAAIEEGVSVDVLATSLFARFRSRRDHTFGEKLLSAMRSGFGGHGEARSKR